MSNKERTKDIDNDYLSKTEQERILAVFELLETFSSECRETFIKATSSKLQKRLAVKVYEEMAQDIKLRLLDLDYEMKKFLL